MVQRAFPDFGLGSREQSQAPNNGGALCCSRRLQVCKNEILKNFEKKTVFGCRDVVQISDRHDKFVFSNTASKKLLGYSTDELNDRNVWDIQTPLGVSEMVLSENDLAVRKSNSNGFQTFLRMKDCLFCRMHFQIFESALFFGSHHKIN